MCTASLDNKTNSEVFIDAPFILSQRLVGEGPSSKMCLECPPQELHRNLTQGIIAAKPTSNSIATLPTGYEKLGHLVPHSYLDTFGNNQALHPCKLTFLDS